MAATDYLVRGQVQQGRALESTRPRKSSRDPKLRPRRPTAGPPTMEYLQGLKSAMQAAYQVQDIQIDTMRHLREMTEPVPVPDELRRVDSEIRDALIADEIARVAASIRHNDPVCQVTPLRMTDIGQQNATTREHWTEELLLRDAGRRIIGMPTYRTAVDACLADGGAWTKLVFTSHTWEEMYGLKWADYADDPEYPAKGKSATAKYSEAREDAKKLSGTPLAWLPVDVRSIYPVYEGNLVVEVLEVSERSTIDTLDRHGLGYDPGRGEFYERVGPEISESETEGLPPTVTFLEYWNEKYCSYACESGNAFHVIKTIEHHYGRHPYFWAPGLMHNQWRGRKVGWSVSASKEYLVRFKQFLETLAVQEVAQQVGKPVIRKRAHPAESIIGNNQLPKESEEWPLNELLNWDKDDEVEAWPVEPITPALQQLIVMVSQEVERLTTPRVAGDIAGAGLEGAGFAITTVLTEAKLRHADYVESLQQMLTDVTKFAWHLVRDIIGEDVYVQWTDRKAKPGQRATQYLGLGPDELSEGVGVKWDINVEQASALLIESRMWNERLQSGTAHIDMVVEALGNNPDEVRRGRTLDRIRQRDWYMQAEEKALLQGLRRGDLMRQAAEMAATTGLLPGMPPEFLANAMQQGGNPALGGPGMPGDQAALGAAPNMAGVAGVPGPGNVGMPAQAPVPTRSVMPAVNMGG